jgi:NADPH:quinone reductase-like Zn-dependent oxidoreductase
LIGARVIATTSSDEKANRLAPLGADSVINYRTTPDWHLKVRELTGDRGVDQVIDIGGATLEGSIKSTAWEGEVEFSGMLDRAASALDINTLSTAIAKLRVVTAGNRAQFIAMNRAIAVAGLKPVIDRVFGFDELKAAFRYYESHRPLGKVVIRHG